VVESAYPHRARVDNQKYHSVIYKATDISPLPFDACEGVHGHPHDDVVEPAGNYYNIATKI